MIPLRQIRKSELPSNFTVTTHAIDRLIERLPRKQLKRINDYDAYLESVAREGELLDPPTYRQNPSDPTPVCNYTKTDGQVVVAVVVPLEDGRLADEGYVTTTMLRSEHERMWRSG